jgi:hypothetical protein
MQTRKIPGYLLAIISYIISYASSLEIWVMALLGMLFYAEDSLAKWIGQVLFMNVIVG